MAEPKSEDIMKRYNTVKPADYIEDDNRNRRNNKGKTFTHCTEIYWIRRPAIKSIANCKVKSDWVYLNLIT